MYSIDSIVSIDCPSGIDSWITTRTSTCTSARLVSSHTVVRNEWTCVPNKIQSYDVPHEIGRKLPPQGYILAVL